MKIRVNGKWINTDCGNLYSLKKSCNSCGEQNVVVIYNGFQTTEDYVLKENDEIVFIRKGEVPPKEEWEAMMMARHTPGVQEKVKQSRVAVAGLGGLGSSIAMALARTGVGHLHLVDMDVVEPSNLNRQQYRISHLGMAKTEALRQQIEEVNPYILVTTDLVKVTQKNVMELFKQDEIICEAFDDPKAKAMLVNGLLEHFPEKKVVAGSGMAGYESSNSIVTKRVLKNLYLCGDRETDARVGRGLMAPRVSICAGHQANMVLRLILGINEV